MSHLTSTYHRHPCRKGLYALPLITRTLLASICLKERTNHKLRRNQRGMLRTLSSYAHRLPHFPLPLLPHHKSPLSGANFPQRIYSHPIPCAVWIAPSSSGPQALIPTLPAIRDVPIDGSSGSKMVSISAPSLCWWKR